MHEMRWRRISGEKGGDIRYDWCHGRYRNCEKGGDGCQPGFDIHCSGLILKDDIPDDIQRDRWYPERQGICAVIRLIYGMDGNWQPIPPIGTG